MTVFGFRQNLLRPASGEDAHRVTYAELFFDLVFVFAITQTSHLLLHETSAAQLGRTAMMTLVVWWVWVYTTWITNWLWPERGVVRAALMLMMLLGLLVAAAIPQAFGERALLFAVCMVSMKLIGSITAVLAFARRRPGHAVNFVRISVWHLVPGVIWIVGALTPDSARVWIWLAALIIDYLGPRLRFVVPGLGASPVSTWNVSGEHMSERVSLFIIIVLGESIVVTGSTFGDGTLSGMRVLAFLAAFAATVLLWLIYFTRGGRGGSRYISTADAGGRGLIAQVAYTYVPAIMVGGILLSAVADGLVLHSPGAAATAWSAGLLCGAPALYLVGYALFTRSVGAPWRPTHPAGIVLLAVVFALHPLLTPLAVSWLVNLVLAAVVVSDELLWRHAQARTRGGGSSRRSR